MMDSNNDKLFQFLREHAPVAPPRPADERARLARKTADRRWRVSRQARYLVPTLGAVGATALWLLVDGAQIRKNPPGDVESQFADFAGLLAEDGASPSDEFAALLVELDEE